MSTPAPGIHPDHGPYQSIAVIGSGAWGTALALKAAQAGRRVRLWGRNPEDLATIRKTGENMRYLPGIHLPEGLDATADMAEAVEGADCVLLVTPSVTLREICRQVAPHIAAGAPVVLCAKGIETGSGKLLSEVASEELPGHPMGALSGPTFARETALNYPTAVTLAFPFAQAHRRDPQAAPASRLALSLGSDSFRPYISDDLVGVEVAGAVKNVVAIACGMMTGAGYAENTRAALITWGIDEMKALAEALGGRRETVAGLSGVGDLTLTCSSTTSRNMHFGVQLGSGISRENVFDGTRVVVEGEVNAISVIDLADRIGIDMPVSRAVHDILHEGADLRDTFAGLWSRPLTGESKFLNVLLRHPMAE
ncbi:glycerol-3-phosphate dehydrogenase (NAD(P)+) [Aliiruegeria haliotis]|uniref:Glycerol-3-phosphate dehydrogenase [NAD(P)+] n=1 Tax=Aliiruegeria haliotis TaxID=1280846 RepID=A0A2T0RNB0_9RHOB|nr:NAD(P)H-dependent glycerol-3-phosphate dehydrogenase [Aliiruegeria haliotis]PRY22612.1 glycerol-3-phosphate dehydrogenase (NAD(P)+) [Aliiruegeria haliotis]